MSATTVGATRQRTAFGFLGGLGLLLLGIAALVAALSVTAASRQERRSTANAQAMTSRPPQEEHSFRLQQLGDYRRDQFLVDQVTGRVWQSVCTGEVRGADCDGLVIWEEMYVREITPDDSFAAAVYRLQLNADGVGRNSATANKK